MKKKSAARSAFFDPRVLINLLRTVAMAIGLLLLIPQASRADGVLTYGDKDVLGTGNYSQDPTTGATLLGLPAGQVTFGAPPTFHSYPFYPDPTEYPGTDQIFAGSNQTGHHDGYSNFATRGPQVITLDYSSLVPAGTQIDTFTLGIAADDFQFPVWGQPFLAYINGTVNVALQSTLNSLVQTGPVVQFFSIGLDPASLDPSNVLTLMIDEGGDGGDGWAVDFLTVGVQTITAATRVDGSGSIENNQGNEVTFRFSAAQADDSSRLGQFTFCDTAAGKCTARARVESLSITGNSASFSGQARLDGGTRVTFSVSVTDNGEPGTSDTISISLSNGYSVSGTLTSGDIRIR